MANLEIGTETLTVRLRPLEHVLGFSRDVEVPLTSVLRVSAAEGKWLLLRGWRSSGFAFPGRLAVGTRRHGSGWDFTAVDRHHDVVVVELSAGRFEQLMVSVPDAAGVARRIAAAAGISG